MRTRWGKNKTLLFNTRFSLFLTRVKNNKKYKFNTSVNSLQKHMSFHLNKSYIKLCAATFLKYATSILSNQNMPLVLQ